MALKATDPKDVADLLKRNQVLLSHRGQPVAWELTEDGQGIRFYGQAIDSPYSDHNVYWVERGRGQVIRHIDGSATGAVEGGWYWEQTAHEQNNLLVITQPLEPGSDYWVWNSQYAHGADVIADLPLTAPGAVAAQPASVRVRLLGRNSTPAETDHRVEVLLNGRSLGWAEWDGLEYYEVHYRPRRLAPGRRQQPAVSRHQR
jgi:hypothetical protein